MASILKRKRDPVEVLDTPKRTKSVKRQSAHPLPKISDDAGWDAAFNPRKTDLVQTNGINGSGSHGDLASPEAEDYEEIMAKVREPVKESQSTSERVKNKKKAKLTVQEIAANLALKDLEPWKLSDPIAGRMVDVSPVFTNDEKFLIVANRSTINVYSTHNSLLTRSIKLKINPAASYSTRIIAYCLSLTQANIVWVACSDGSIFSIDWATGAGSDQYWGISSTGCIHMTVASMESAGRRRDVVFTTEIKKDGGFRITANELAAPNSPIKTMARTIYTSSQRIQFLKTAEEGSVIVGASGNRILLGRLRSTEYDTVDKIRYEFRIFESTDAIKSLDIQVSERTLTEGLKKSSVKKMPVVDLVVGDIRGVIFVHNDLLAKLFQQSQDGKLPPGISLAPRKLHWHRQAVHTVKWSRDGNYIISGGTETVLVLWQLDTGKQEFLPHMSATIQNVVVSPTGSSYAVQLSDNSTMILSTAELKPTANIAGIQACVVEAEPPLESKVERLQEQIWQPPLVQRTPAVINPSNPTRLLLGTGQIQEIQVDNPLILRNPFLQTFDLASSHNLTRQPLTRTNITNINAAPSAHRLSEPRVTHIKISQDGNWLATVDEWEPVARDLDHLKHQGKDLSKELQHRREVYLKFWQWNKGNEIWELVSRINSPHTLRTSSDAGKILDLTVDPSSLRFSSLGEDGIVRTWTTKTRKRDGIVVRGKDGKGARSWGCQHAISIGQPELVELSNNLDNSATSGSITFSGDGSILAAATNNDDGLVHLIDPATGTIRRSYTDIFENDIVKMEFLGKRLIILSDELLVFDVVAEEISFIMKSRMSIVSLSCAQKREMMHLAVDQQSETFALSLPISKTRDILAAGSELLVFHQDQPEPQFQQAVPALVTALLPAVGSEGYLVLDTSAEIYTVLKKGTQAVTALAQSTSALQLDTAPEEPALDLSQLADEAEEVEHQLPTPEPTQDGNEDDIDDENPVVTQQQLSAVFDIGPAFALPPLEEMFYQVADLFSSKPLAKSVS